jgi:Glycosyl hydrolase family 47
VVFAGGRMCPRNPPLVIGSFPAAGSAMQTHLHHLHCWCMKQASDLTVHGLPDEIMLHPQGYPLRPELAESTFLLHAATGDADYLAAGRELQVDISVGFSKASSGTCTLCQPCVQPVDTI